MQPEFNDELLSAHLDGELDASEQPVVEQQLASSPADSQLLGDLQTMQSDLAALPKAEVSADFTDRVLNAVDDRLN